MSKFTPMLAVPVDISLVRRLASGTEWAFLAKLDGRRLVALVTDGEVKLVNRSGKEMYPRHPIAKAFTRLPAGSFILDGELMSNGILYLFDAPRVQVGEKVLIDLDSPYSERSTVLAELVKRVWPGDKRVQFLHRATTPEHKLRLFHWIKDHHGEGIVARKMDGKYFPNKRSPVMVKIKFVQSADCIVIRKGDEGKDNLVLGVYDRGRIVEVGKVSALVGDGPRAKVGDVLDVEYLSFSPDGRMIQPTNPRLRVDKFPKHCCRVQFSAVNSRQIEVPV